MCTWARDCRQQTLRLRGRAVQLHAASLGEVPSGRGLPERLVFAAMLGEGLGVEDVARELPELLGVEGTSPEGLGGSAWPRGSMPEGGRLGDRLRRHPSVTHYDTSDAFRVLPAW